MLGCGVCLALGCTTPELTDTGAPTSTDGDGDGDPGDGDGDPGDGDPGDGDGDPGDGDGDPGDGDGDPGDGDGDPGLADPAVFRTPDVNAVCQPTPRDPCTASDMTWAVAEYGVEIGRFSDEALAAAGHGYRLVELSEREGPSNIDVFVVDELGDPIAGLPVAFYFSTAPDPSNPDEWYPVKVSGVTEVDGRVGFALTASAYLDACGGGGPHAIWVSEPGAAPQTTIPSDLADRLGMLGGTNHRHLDLLFQRTPAVGPAPVDATHCPL